jgi:hypothetical protein
MNKCRKCGCEVRLRAMRITVNRKRGTANWIEHREKTECGGTAGFEATTWRGSKPPKEFEMLIERWDQENPEDD